MSDDFDLIAEIREDQGKGASRRLRHQGKVPAIIYGAGRPPRALLFDHNKVLKQLENESFYSSVLNIKVGNKSQAAILKDMQRHPAKPRIMHMDFQRIVEDQEIKMNVPLHFIGEDIAPGVKVGGGKISHLRTDVEIVCLPRNLPEYLELDVSELELDAVIHLSEVIVPDDIFDTAVTVVARSNDGVRACFAELVCLDADALHAGELPGRTAVDEIGRASCRERVSLTV